MIFLDNVTKFYPTGHGRHYVFQDVTFEFPDGVNIGIIGRNGAGKTTLLRLLAGADMPSRGKIVRTGRISWPLGLTSAVQRSLSGVENARFACRIQGIPASEMEGKIAQIREFAELGKFFDLPVNTYSSGMKGRLNFAIAMAFDFDTYLIDELTATGDLSFNEKARTAFKLKRDAASFIKCSHNMHELLTECDSGVLLDRGKFTYFPKVEDAAKAYLAIVAPGNEDVWTRTLRRVERSQTRNEPPDAAEAPRHTNGRRMRHQEKEAASTKIRRPRKPDSEGEEPALMPHRRERKARKEERRARRQSRMNTPAHVPAPMAPRVANSRSANNDENT
jgi:capsular polysaccharide transport system ATP-binding protein